MPLARDDLPFSAHSLTGWDAFISFRQGDRRVKNGTILDRLRRLRNTVCP
jgi:hypothetical protein